MNKRLNRKINHLKNKKINNASNPTKNPPIKDLLPPFVLSIVISFMLFLFEPITMYATNPDDFWFDLHLLFPTLLSSAFVFFLYIFIALLFCYILFRVILKKITVYYIVVSIVFYIFIILYIHGNFLSGSLPVVYGDPFLWRHYKKESLISIGFSVVSAVTLIVAFIRFKPIKVFSIIPFVSSAIFIMLGVSLISTLFTTDALKDKAIYTYSYNNFDTASNNQNFFILLVDAIDAKYFTKIRAQKKDSDELFKDFTFYQDTLSCYPSTRDTLPYIFNPVPNHNETDFLSFAKKAYSDSKLFSTLKSTDFNMNFYDVHYFMDTKTASNFQNTVFKSEIESKPLLKQIIKFDLFKYLPYPLKGRVHIEDLNFSSTKKEGEYEPYDYKDVHNYQKFQSDPITTIDDKVFHFIYTEGAHVPYNLDEKLNTLPNNNGTYIQKANAVYLLIKAYLKRLKKYNVYDNSAIVIMADHGVLHQSDKDRFNPILFIKGVDESHEKMPVSNKPIQFSDLEDAFIQLSKKTKSTDLFQDIDYPRTRTALYSFWTHEKHIIEYQTDGKAWEGDKFKPTGNVYDLKE